MKLFVRIPPRFLADHTERDLPTPASHGTDKGGVRIRLDDPATPELLSDAEYYADPWGPTIDIGLRSSARATAKAIKDALAYNEWEARLLADRAKD